VKHGISGDRTVAKGMKDFNCYVYMLQYNAIKYCFADMKKYLPFNIRDTFHSNM